MVTNAGAKLSWILFLILLSAAVDSYEEWCYQESVDQATSCGGFDGGQQSCSGDWDPSNPCTYGYDNSWSTGARTSTVYSGGSLEVNFSLSPKATNLSRLQIKDSNSSTVNYSIPASCFYNDYLRFYSIRNRGTTQSSSG